MSLTKLVESGQFRGDLFFRLHILFVEIPPLRLRKGDPELLARHFAQLGSHRFAKSPIELHPDTLHWFACYGWPGNVRELENVVYRALLLADEPVVVIPPLTQCRLQRRKLIDRRNSMYEGLTYSGAKARAIEDFERKYLSSLMATCHGNVTEAAKIAGTERRYLGKLIKRFQVDHKQFRTRVNAEQGT